MKTPSFWRRKLHALGRGLEQLSGLVGAPSFTGAVGNRLTMDWVRAATSPDKDAQGSLAILRSRSRDLQKNSAYGAQYIRLLKDNIIGPRGITLQSKVMTQKKNFDVVTNESVEAGWARWGMVGNCTVDGKLSWLGVQHLVAGLLHGDGEVFLRLRRLKTAGGLRFALEIVDPDLVDEELNVAPTTRGGAEVRQGVEVDAQGRPIAYHLFPRHPNDINGGALRAGERRVRVPAEEMLHLFVPLRPGQTRGVPGLSPVMYALRMLGGYQEAEVVAARVSATKLGVITQDAENFSPVPNEAPNDGPVTMDAEPGSFWKLMPGEAITPFDPQHPGTAYKEFVKGVLQQIAAGMGVSYASLTADLEGTSYASGRTGLLQERDRYRAVQQWLIEHCHQRVFAAWLDVAVVTGEVPLPPAKVEAVLAAATWQPRGFAWVDPKNDVDASIQQLQYGLTSRTRLLAEQGLDIEETLDELSREHELAEEKDVAIDGKVVPPPAPAAAEPEPEDGSEIAEDAAEKAAEKVTSRTLRLMQDMPAHATPAEAERRIEFLEDADGKITGAVVRRVGQVALSAGA